MYSPLPQSKVQEVLSAIGCVLAVGFLALLLVPGSPGMLDTPALVALVVRVLLAVAYYFIMMKRMKNVPEDVTQEKLLQLHA